MADLLQAELPRLDVVMRNLRPRKTRQQVLSGRAGGVGIVSERQRPSRWFAPPNLYVLGQSVSGQKIDQEPYGVDASSRGVHFFVTADTHFGNIEPDNPPPGPSPNEQDVIEEMHLRLSQDPSIRGICLAGDLVDYVTRYTLGIPLEDYTALNLYNASMGSWSRFHYDGVGEGHDYNELHFQVVDEVANRKHRNRESAPGLLAKLGEKPTLSRPQGRDMPLDTVAAAG